MSEIKEHPINAEDLMAIVEMELNGYVNIKKVAGFGWCGIRRNIFTYAICFGIDGYTTAGRFCFDSYVSALHFLDAWDGSRTPVVGVGGCTAIK